MTTSLQTLVRGATVLLALALAAVLAVFVAAMLALRGGLDRERDAYRDTAAASLVDRAALDADGAIRLAFARSPGAEEQRRRMRAAAAGAVSSLRMGTAGSAEAERAEHVVRTLRSYVANAERLIRRAEMPRGSAGARVARAEETQRRRRVLGMALDAWFALQRQQAAEAYVEATRYERRALRLGVGILVSTGVLVLLAGLAFGRSVVAPVRTVAAAARRVAGGELQTRVVPEGIGEIAELGRSFNAMTDALEASSTELAQLLSVSAAVIVSVQDAIVVVDDEGRVILANEQANELASGYGPFGGNTFYEATAGIADRATDPEAFRRNVAAIEADPELVATDDYELGDGRFTRRYTAPFHDTTGRRTGRIFVYRDITAERRSDRLKSEIIATVSHELRTPLTGIAGYAELLAERDVDVETRREWIETIRRETWRLAGLVDELLDLRRIDSGNVEFELGRFSLRELLEEQAAVYRAQSARHSIELSLPDDPLEVLASRDAVAQVVSNLLSNAVKYSPRGGAVLLAGEHANGRVRVSVADRGLGIERELHADVFEKFFRVDSSDTREIGGTGLGLALAREIVEAHGGTIGVYSEPGRGSEFWFELPGEEAG